MTDDLRDQLAQAMKPAIAELALTSTDNDIEDAAYNAADAILAWFAIAGPLPEPDTRYQYLNADRWIGDPNSPIVYLAANGQIDFAGPGYWATRKGDDPRPFAAAIIAAYAKAQEQRHE